MTCKDCIYYEACNLARYHTDLKIKICSIDTENCKRFKDRSKFIELPCKVGDIIYQPVITPVKKIVSEYDVVSFKVYKNTTFVNLKLRKGKIFGSLSRFVDDIGVVLFFTREEAEQALRERNENRSD